MVDSLTSDLQNIANHISFPSLHESHVPTTKNAGATTDAHFPNSSYPTSYQTLKMLRNNFPNPFQQKQNDSKERKHWIVSLACAFSKLET